METLVYQSGEYTVTRTLEAEANISADYTESTLVLPGAPATEGGEPDPDGPGAVYKTERVVEHPNVPGSRAFRGLLRCAPAPEGQWVCYSYAPTDAEV